MDNGNGIEEESLLILQKEIQNIRENPMQHLPESSHWSKECSAEIISLNMRRADEIRI